MIGVWKYIGDEVMLMTELTCDVYQSSIHVLALAETIKQINNEYKNKPLNNDENNILQVKVLCTAWVAGFPVDNIEIAPPSGGRKEKDYLGPLIDLGFRLSKFSTKDRLIISASLAYFIAKESRLKKPIIYMDKQMYRLPLCFGGIVEVKGVRNNKHPLIWYPVNESTESELCFVEHKKLLSFLENDHFKKWPYQSFIPGTCKFPNEYIIEYEKVVGEQKQIPPPNPVRENLTGKSL